MIFQARETSNTRLEVGWSAQSIEFGLKARIAVTAYWYLPRFGYHVIQSFIFSF